MLPFLLALAPAAIPQQQEVEDAGSVAEMVSDAVGRMQGGTIRDVFGAARDVADLGDPAVPALRRTIAETTDPWVKLGCVKALAELDAAGDQQQLLVELAGPDSDPDVRIAAIDTLSAFAGTEVSAAIEDYLDRTYDPRVKVALATALFEVGRADAADRLRARGELSKLLKSENRQFRIMGALALAEIGDFDTARSVLYEIDDEPSEEGALARAYIAIDQLQHRVDRREQQNLLESRAANDEFQVLKEILSLIRRHHIHGEQYLDEKGEEELVAAAARGMLGSLDRHSTYFSPTEYERWLLDLNREYAGIGAYVQTIDGVFTITRPIYSGPAYELGLRSDDKVLKVDGWETYNENQDEIIKRLKGEPGTTVKIEVFRTGWKEPREFTIARRLIDIPSANYDLFPGGIGYVELLTFGQNTSAELRDALKELESRGAKGFILDLRNNPGGYLNAAKDIVGEFMGPGRKVVYTEGRDGEAGREWHYTPDRGFPGRDQPLAILVNRRSASASEIVAGALRYYERAHLVGEKTFGKGSVQNPFHLESRQEEPFTDVNGNGMFDEGERYRDLNENGKFDYGASVKLTTQRYYLPDGRSIHTEIDPDGREISAGGIEPDVEIEFETIDAWKAEELADLLEKDVFRTYVDERYEQNKELFMQLAEGDSFDDSRYPDFDAFFSSLNTHLDRDDVRREVRLAARDRVVDDRGRNFPGNRLYGDYQEDSQLQRAIVDLLRTMQSDAGSIPEYARFAHRFDEAPASEGDGQVRNDGG